MRVLSNKWTGAAVYLAFVLGISLICAGLSSHLAKQAIALAMPYMPAEGPRPLSLVERRRFDAAQAGTAHTDGTEVADVSPAALLTPPQILAAQLDLAENEDRSVVTPEQRPAHFVSRRIAQKALRPPTDE